MLKYRILTALVLIPLVFLAIYYLPPLYFSGVALIFILMAAWEWATLIGWNKWYFRITYLCLITVVLFISLLTLPTIIPITLASIWWFGWMIYLFFIRNKTALPKIPKWLIGFAGVFILVACWDALVVLKSRNPDWLMFLLLLVWFADIAAYFGGRRYGKHPLAPAISPNKTIEGMLAGIFAAFILAFVVQRSWGEPSLTSHWGWISIAFPAILAAVVGDLFESLLKRTQGIKDSGQLLPGHGGLLDRVDSLLAAAPVFVCGIFALRL